MGFAPELLPGLPGEPGRSGKVTAARPSIFISARADSLPCRSRVSTGSTGSSVGCRLASRRQRTKGSIAFCRLGRSPSDMIGDRQDPTRLRRARRSSSSRRAVHDLLLHVEAQQMA
jgi:hypothetical protein